MSRFPLRALIAGAVVFTACAEQPTGSIPLGDVFLTVVSGDGQSAQINQELPQPLVVRLTGANGKGVRGQLVNFRVTAGGGTMYAGAALTDMNGVAQDYWTLGGTAGAQAVAVVAVDPTSGTKQNFGSFAATALAPAALSVTPSSANFGTVSQGGSSAALGFTVTNIGDETSGPVSVSLAGAHAADYQVTTDSCGVALSGGATCTVSLVFTPQSSGTRAATLQATASPGGNASSTLTGSGALAAVLTVTPSNVDFGSLLVGGTSNGQNFTVQNVGGASASGLVVALGGPNAADFLIQGTTCTGVTLSPGQGCVVGVQFRPTAVGSRTASLNLSATGGVAGTAALSGTGIATAQLTILPATQVFPPTEIGSVATARTFAITNTGQQVSGVVTVSLAGANPQDFIIAGNQCLSMTLLPGRSCTVVVSFSPTAVGSRAATLTATASPGGVAIAALSGTGFSTPALIVISPASHSFGSVVTGASSSPQTFTVTNVGDSPSGALAIALSGFGATAFSFAGFLRDTCSGNTLAADASCTVIVTFTPGSLGNYTATLTASASPGGSASSSLSGTGVSAATLSISPTSFDFGAQAIGVPSRISTLTITNTGGTVTGTIQRGLTGPNASEFSISRDTCTGATLMPNASCQADVVFTPLAPGVRTATIGFSAVPGGSVTALLSGTGS